MKNERSEFAPSSLLNHWSFFLSRLTEVEAFAATFYLERYKVTSELMLSAYPLSLSIACHIKDGIVLN